MKKEIFEKEIAMCRRLNKENNGRCNWGECEKCGVIPLLYKLHRGEFHESGEEAEDLKKTVFK